jgi:Cu(I)/Ag(I) efflux system membrane fusion protein
MLPGRNLNMTNKIVFTLLVLAAFAVGVVVGPKINQGGPAETSGATTEEPSEREILYWVAPMDPNYRRDEPGKSPMGMDLVPVYADEAGGGDAVTISPSVENNLGVRTETARVRPLWRRIEATGYVSFDESRISHISMRVQGWIVRLQVDAEGERVSKGDLLFELYSPELVNAQKEFLQAQDHESARLRAGAEEKLRALGMNPSEIAALRQRGTASENVKFIAPQDGIVTSLSVREGMFIQPNTTVMSLVDLSSVWLQAEVFESQADWVAAGQAAEATLDYMPGTTFSGQVDFVYPVLDPKTRTLRVRLLFDNPEERLKPNMYARVSIYGRLKPNALSISREALIPAPGADRVVVALGAGKFRVHEVLTGLESGEHVEVLAGISEGDEVVTSAQFLIDSESSIAGSIQRLEALDELPEQRPLGQVFASGQVGEIYLEQRRIRISHGPIDALGWPSMTMVFDTRPGVDLSEVKVGQDIRFALEQEQAGEYVLERILSGENGMEDMTRDQFEQMSGAASAPQSESEQTGNRRISAAAIVRGVDSSGSQLKLEHEPIDELGWPAMTMNFSVDPAVSLDSLAAGQSIHFSMVETEKNRWVIDQIHVMGEDSGEAGHDHD